MTRKEVGDALGITPQAVGLLVKRGMPVTSIAAARAWRERNIDLTRSRPARPKPSSPDYVTSDRLPWTEDDIERAHAQLRLFAKFAEDDFAAWQAPLRMAMAALPSPEWDRVDLSESLWRQLVGEHELTRVKRGKRQRAPVLGPFESEHFLYLLAAGFAQGRRLATSAP